MSESQENRDRRSSLFDEWNESHLNQQAAAKTQLALTQPTILIREISALVLLVLLCDVTVYRNQGFAGPGVLFLMAPFLLYLGTVRRKVDLSVWLLAPLLLFVSVRLLWCGSPLAVLSGSVLLCCFSMGLAGHRPYMTRVFVFASQLIAAGHRGLNLYLQSISRFSPKLLRTHWFAVLLPLATLVTFATIFVLANPDLVKSFGNNLSRFVEMLERWMSHFQMFEIGFCFAATWIVTGMLRPDVSHVPAPESTSSISEESQRSPLYDAYRNTLAVVIGLFAVYLAFEFQTLWFKSFPKGFHYSGYAHEGAAWLTMALGLATAILSLIFRGSILTDPRLSRLRTLSWIWSIENLLLAMAVFNRLFIYIGFNGMTQMRVVGMLGVASVVVGFLLVLRKIACNADFVWLIRRQLWTVSLAAYLFAVLPVDAFVNQFNVNCILAGNFAPSVQISVHPTSAEGLLCLQPLIHCSNSVIRNGVRAILDEKLDRLEMQSVENKTLGWTVTQVASDRLLKQLREAKTAWKNDPPSATRDEALKVFRDYAYQWY